MDIARTIQLRPGRYVVAVSGGVDSMALLHMLQQRYALDSKPDNQHQFVVAHYDHGIREDSHQDKQLIHDVTLRYKLPFVFDKGRLGPRASEVKARQARYDFLRKVKQQAGARDIVTAHHLDDAIETAIFNMMRGTGRRGVSPLHNQSTDVVRPLLHVPKDRLVAYAHQHNLHWHEDSTNQDLRYRRNYIRHQIIPQLKANDPAAYHRLAALIRRTHDINTVVDREFANYLHTQDEPKKLRRHDVIVLPHNVGRELVAHWLRENGRRQLDRKRIEQLLSAIKTAEPGRQFDVDNTLKLRIGKRDATLQSV